VRSAGARARRAVHGRSRALGAPAGSGRFLSLRAVMLAARSEVVKTRSRCSHVAPGARRATIFARVGPGAVGR
jgi:hypothetical protein